MQISGLFVLLLLCGVVLGAKNLIGTEIQKCLNCLCHARSGCWSRFNCARYSITKEYWERAGSPSNATYALPDQAYTACMDNENCILNAIKSYTESFGLIDCNCDGRFDCKDRFAIHLFGEKCINPKYGPTYARRFNDCAAAINVRSMLAEEETCGVQKRA